MQSEHYMVDVTLHESNLDFRVQDYKVATTGSDVDLESGMDYQDGMSDLEGEDDPGSSREQSRRGQSSGLEQGTPGAFPGTQDGWTELLRSFMLNQQATGYLRYPLWGNLCWLFLCFVLGLPAPQGSCLERAGWYWRGAVLPAHPI
uniref:Uncharacterized protein n=1 Tax=Sphaerodactylus townsendi TaxID=933632 RepID=A0ACB8FUZ7_9SAUR